jgi:hypothetical protein
LIQRRAVVAAAQQRAKVYRLKAEDMLTTYNNAALVDQLYFLNGETLAVLKMARATGANELALKAIARLESQIALAAKLSGELSEAPTLKIQLSAEWVALRGAILAALEPHPEARLAIAGVLNSAEE